jgi:hypothetical protein
LPVNDADLVKMIDLMGDHYRNNINNRYIRKALLSLQIPPDTWAKIERLTTRSGHAEANGYQYEELYEMILAAATLISRARKHVVPNAARLGGRVRSAGPRPAGESRGEEVLREMAFRTLGQNLSIFSDHVHSLYMKSVELDKRDHAGQKCVYERLPELKGIGKLLIATE